MAKDTELAWCAGFFDGEGHVSYHRHYPHLITGTVTGSMRCNVPQASDNIEVLIKFQSIVGLGKLKGPYKMGKKGKTQHKVIFGVKEVEPLFLLLQPYLGTEKSNDFRNALMMYSIHDHNATSEDWAKRWKMHEKKANKSKEKNNG